MMGWCWVVPAEKGAFRRMQAKVEHWEDGHQWCLLAAEAMPVLCSRVQLEGLRSRLA
jgi:hypothetical protein